MRNLWLVAKHEFRNTAVRRGFILLTLAVPLGILALIGMAIAVEMSGESDLPLGYVDPSGFLDISRYDSLPDHARSVGIQVFADQDTALVALERSEIQAVFVFPAEYPENLQTDLYYLESPPNREAWEELDDFVRANLIAEYPEDVRARLFDGPDLTVHDVASGRRFSESGVANIVLPFVATVFFFFATMLSGGFMLGVVAGEKENRTIEVMITSMTPLQLIGGKTLGLLAASLLQLGIYALATVVGLMVAAPSVPELQQLQVPWGYLGIMVLFFFPSYVLISAIMVAIGGAVTELQQGQQVSGLLNILFMLPILLMPLLFDDPGHPLLVFLTFFPTTAFLTVSLRWGLGTVPLWQIVPSWLLLIIATLFMVWAAARVFRAGMLRYGQPLNLKAAMAAIRGS